MSDKYILDADGNPVPEPDLMTWAQWMQTAVRSIARDEIDGVTVSTVFLGLDHSFFSGPPVLWETMIFGGPHNDYQRRYSTRDEALVGHCHAVWLANNPSPD